MQDGEIIRNKRPIGRKNGLKKNRGNERRGSKSGRIVRKEERSVHRNRALCSTGSIPAINVTIKPKKLPKWFDPVYSGYYRNAENAIENVLIMYPDLMVDPDNWYAEVIRLDQELEESYGYLRINNGICEAESKDVHVNTYFDFLLDDLLLFDDQFSNDILMILVTDMLGLVMDPFVDPEQYADYIDTMLEESDEKEDQEYYQSMLDEIPKVDAFIGKTINKINSYNLNVFDDMDWFITFFHAKKYFKTAEFLHKNRGMISLCHELDKAEKAINYYRAFYGGVFMTLDRGLSEMFKEMSQHGEAPFFKLISTFKHGEAPVFGLLVTYFNHVMSKLVDVIYSDFHDVNPK